MNLVMEKDGVQIYVDPDPVNPREWDNVGRMVCFHKRYDLGDRDHGYRTEDYNSWLELRQAIDRDHGPCTILPVFMMNHGGLFVSTDPTMFRMCDPQGYDWGQIGFVYCSEARATDLNIRDVEAVLRAEVETYNKYLRGEVYGFVYGEDSCWGFYQEPGELVEDVLKGAV